jgi:peptidoglycan hydrolase-like protein with peptidoglycan-binding domain
MHVSVREDARNDLSPWPWTLPGLSPQPAPPSPPGQVPNYPGAPLRLGSRGVHVSTVQQRLRILRKNIVADGVFGLQTQQAVVVFQKERRLKPDGVIGPRTWTALFWVR